MLMILARLVRSESFWAVVKVRSPHTGPEPGYPRLARGELDKLEGPNYAARRAELRRAAREAARARQTAAASQNEAEESDESEDETAGERTRTRVRRTRGGMKVAARIGEKLRREIGIIGSGGRPRLSLIHI